MTSPPLSAAATVRGTYGPPDGDRILILYTGGTIGMAPGRDGALAPLEVSELVKYVQTPDGPPVGLTVASFERPIDSAAIRPADWLAIADAVQDLAGDHVGIVILHGTDTMAYTSSALSFLLEGIDRPVVLTGAQRPLTVLRSDAAQNLTTATAIAARRQDRGPAVAEVCLFFNDVLLRGNRATKSHADSYAAFSSPNLAPLARAGVTLEVDPALTRPAQPGPPRRTGATCPDVAAVRLHPALDQATLSATLATPGLRGVVLEAYGAGNAPTEPWFLGALTRATADGIVVVVTTQCGAGTVRAGHYATGAALFATGAVTGHDLTFEAALTKLMVLLNRNSPQRVRELMPQPIAGELTVAER